MQSTWMRRVGLRIGLAAGLAGAAALASAAEGPRALTAPDFVEAAAQGFGDRQNSEAMSMFWWKDHLYVGTNRANACVQQAAISFHRPDLGGYPPTEEDLECTPLPEDLPLQAEIWRWSPLTDEWEMLYRSPEDVPIPGHPGKFVARDIAFRGMGLYTESDGTEALYVSGVTARGFNEAGLPPPRILRSTDGVTFEAVPQDPGTFLGDIPWVGFRGIQSYKGRLFILASVGDLGHGVVLESADPASGNDTFHLATPEGMTFFEIQVFNGFLYLGTGVQPLNDKTPFSLFKTDAAGTPPYALVPIITNGADRNKLPGYAVISMQEFHQRLYIGTEREIFRISPDDSYELVVGTPRTTSDGKQLAPLSGLDYGFDNILNIHMWRMGVHDGVFYVGTQDQAARWRNNPYLGPLLSAGMGFDLFASTDGRDFTAVSQTSFAKFFDHYTQQEVVDPTNILNRGVRNFASTPYGMFMGSANAYYGTKIWRANHGSPEIPAPTKLRVEGKGPKTLLSWEAPEGGAVYQVYREQGFHAQELLGTTSETHFFDTTAKGSKTYHYHVTAASSQGVLSGPSNWARSPSLAPVASFVGLMRQASSLGLPSTVRMQLLRALLSLLRGRYDDSLAGLEQLKFQAMNELPLAIGPWKAADLAALIDELIRRVELAQAGLVSPFQLIR